MKNRRAIEDAEQSGFVASLSGNAISSNPYSSVPELSEAWLYGYQHSEVVDESAMHTVMLGLGAVGAALTGFLVFVLPRLV